MLHSQPLPPRRQSDLSPALRRVVAATLAAFAPPPTLTVSQWADREGACRRKRRQNRDSGIPRGPNTFAASWTRSLTRP